MRIHGSSTDGIIKCLWVFFAVSSVVLTLLCFVYVGDRTFSTADRGGLFRGASRPSHGLIFLLGTAINLIFAVVYRLRPDSRMLPQLNIPAKDFWLASAERREMFVIRLRRIVSALGAWIDFLIASTLYMTLHYFYPSLPCPRHLLMILIWFVVSVAVGIFCILQLRKPAN